MFQPLKHPVAPLKHAPASAGHRRQPAGSSTGRPVCAPAETPRAPPLRRDTGTLMPRTSWHQPPAAASTASTSPPDPCTERDRLRASDAENSAIAGRHRTGQRRLRTKEPPGCTQPARKRLILGALHRCTPKGACENRRVRGSSRSPNQESFPRPRPDMQPAAFGGLSISGSGFRKPRRDGRKRAVARRSRLLQHAPGRKPYRSYKRPLVTLSPERARMRQVKRRPWRGRVHRFWPKRFA